MRPPEEVKRTIVQQWLSKAELDLGVAEHLAAEDSPYLEAIGFHAQQAAEKNLKAFLAEYQIEFPKTHDLGELLDLVARVDSSLAGSLKEITVLSAYSVDIRYPSDFPQMTPADARKAVELARRVREGILPLFRHDPGGGKK